MDNLSPRELNGAEGEEKKFLNERGAGVIAALLTGVYVRVLSIMTLLECKVDRLYCASLDMSSSVAVYDPTCRVFILCIVLELLCNYSPALVPGYLDSEYKQR